MGQEVSEHKGLHEAIAQKLAQVANDSLAYSLACRGNASCRPIPILSLTRKIRLASHSEAVGQEVHERFPWLSQVDLSLIQIRLENEGERQKIDPSLFIPTIIEELEMLQASLEAIAAVPWEEEEDGSQSLFDRILQSLNSFTLNQLEKYLTWKGQEIQLEAVSNAWKELCIRHEINLLRKEDNFCWKGYFIARHYKRCLKNGNKSPETLFGVALMYDNIELLRDEKLLALADIETDTR